MKNTAYGNAYYLGLLSGIMLFIGLNWYSFEVNYEGWDRYGKSGVPFPMKDGGNLFANIIWLGLIADIVFGLILSFATGLLFQLFWSKVSARYSNLQ